MNYFYYVIGQKEDTGEINTPVKISESNNLYSVFSGMKNIIYIHQCKTQKARSSLLTFGINAHLIMAIIFIAVCIRLA